MCAGGALHQRHWSRRRPSSASRSSSRHPPASSPLPRGGHGGNLRLPTRYQPRNSHRPRPQHRTAPPSVACDSPSPPVHHLDRSQPSSPRGCGPEVASRSGWGWYFARRAHLTRRLRHRCCRGLGSAINGRLGRGRRIWTESPRETRRCSPLAGMPFLEGATPGGPRGISQGHPPSATLWVRYTSKAHSPLIRSGSSLPSAVTPRMSSSGEPTTKSTCVSLWLTPAATRSSTDIEAPSGMLVE